MRLSSIFNFKFGRGLARAWRPTPAFGVAMLTTVSIGLLLSWVVGPMRQDRQADIRYQLDRYRATSGRKPNQILLIGGCDVWSAAMFLRRAMNLGPRWGIFQFAIPGAELPDIAYAVSDLRGARAPGAKLAILLIRPEGFGEPSCADAMTWMNQREIRSHAAISQWAWPPRQPLKHWWIDFYYRGLGRLVPGLIQFPPLRHYWWPLNTVMTKREQKDFMENWRGWKFREKCGDLLADIVGALRDKGFRVALLVPPVRGDFYEILRGEGTGYASFRRWIENRKRVKADSVFFLPRPSAFGMGDDSMPDPVHLTTKGMEKFSMRLGLLLKKEIVTASVLPRPLSDKYPACLRAANSPITPEPVPISSTL